MGTPSTSASLSRITGAHEDRFVIGRQHHLLGRTTVKRTIAIAIAAALVGLVVLVPTAAASDTSDTTSAPPSDTSSTEVPVTTATEVPVTTTEVPVTTSTEVPVTTTSTPVTTSIPTTGAEAPCLTDCIPVAEAEACTGPECIPTGAGALPTTFGGAGALPFTGIEDMIAPILLALTVVLGGVVAWRWARLRESVAEAAQRARPIAAREARTGYAAAVRNLGIEQRARQVFTPRVA